MSWPGLSAFANTRRKRTPEPTTNGPCLGAQLFGVVSSVPENGIVTGTSSWSARLKTAGKRASNRPSRAST